MVLKPFWTLINLMVTAQSNSMEILLEGRHSDRQIKINGKILSPEISLKYRNHSPDGFAWGYGGSGPAQLALAILIETVGAEKALDHYQDFKHQVIANLPQSDFKKNIQIDIDN